MPALTGGEKLQAYLAKIAGNLASAGNEPAVRVGFLEGVTYPDGTSLPMVAAIQEFGGTIHRAAGTVTIHRKVSAKGTHFLRGGRFVKASQSNFASTHAHGAYTITIPPRPYFRTMIKKDGPGWGKAMGVILKATDFNTDRALKQMGDLIKGQLQQSINDLVSPPLAASTVRRKGFTKPLIDTGVMWRSVDYEVST